MSATEYQLFDNLGRMTQMSQITDGTSYTSKYTYNFAGALVEEEYPSGRKVKNEFESDGDLSRIYGKATPSATERTYANAFSYTPDGRIEKLRLGNGLWEKAKFNPRLQVTELALGHGVNNGDLWKLGYEYGELDGNGNVDTAKNTGNVARQTLSFNGLAHPFVQTYKYDSLYRLTEARETSNGAQTWKQGFTYDRYGNRLTHAKFSGTNQLTHTAVTHPAIDPNTNRFQPGQGYLFDKNGNLTTDAEDRSFVFNGDNKQKEIRDSNDKLVGEYFYDGEGKRVKKKAYQNGILDEETVFVYSSGKLIAEYSNKPPAQTPTTSWTITDQLGSPRVLVNTMGEVVSRRDFLPFGEEINSVDEANLRANAALKYNGDGVRQKFTGYQKDDESGLDFAEARMYENRHGRFTAVDPLLASGKSANPQTFNRYVYVMNSPLVYTDPTGLQAGNYSGGSVYYAVMSDGRWAFSNRRGYSSATGINYSERYDGGRIRIRGIDGYQYTVTSRGWRQQGLDTVAAGRTGTARTAPNAAGDNALLRDLGQRGPAMLKVTTALAILMASPAAGFLLPAGGVGGTGGAVGITTGKGAVIAGTTPGIIMLNPSTGCAGGGPCGDISAEQFSQRIGDIYSKYKAEDCRCDIAAQEALQVFQDAGLDANIVQFQADTNFIMRAEDGAIVGRTGFHQAVQSNGLYYDATTGSTGLTWEEYQKKFVNRLRPVPPQPYYPPSPDDY